MTWSWWQHYNISSWLLLLLLLKQWPIPIYVTQKPAVRYRRHGRRRRVRLNCSATRCRYSLARYFDDDTAARAAASTAAASTFTRRATSRRPRPESPETARGSVWPAGGPLCTPPGCSLPCLPLSVGWLSCDLSQEARAHAQWRRRNFGSGNTTV